MGAPAFMWDDAEALRVARLVTRRGFALEGFGSGAERVLVRRFRRAVVAAVLAHFGELSPVERSQIARWPKFHRTEGTPGTWRPDVTVTDVAEGRVIRGSDAA